MTIEAMVSVTGYIAEVGDLALGLKGAKANRGVTIECGSRDVTIVGLDKEECRALAKFMSDEVIVRITLVAGRE